MAALVNEDGNVVSGSVNTDEDARNLSGYVNPRRGSSDDDERRLSREDEEVHQAYESLYDIVKNPGNYTADQINDIIVEITEEDDSPVVRYGRFAGNYNADLADRESNVYKYWRNYRSHKQRWDAKRDSEIAKKRQELDAKGMKITDEMTPKQKREMADQRRPFLMEVRRKYDRGMLGQQIYYLLGKAEQIATRKEYGSDSDSSDDGGGASAAAKKGGKRKTRRKKRRKKKKSRKKKGGRLEKLGLKINEILKRLRDLEDDVIFLGGETRSNGADIRGNGGDITENAVDIGVIKSYINYKLNNTLVNAATPLDQWQGHLRSIDRRSHQEPPPPIDIAILRDANMRGGKRKKRKTKRKRKKRKKRKRKSKKRHRKKKGGIAHAIIKAQVWPANYTPAAEVANPQAFREPTWMRQL